MPNPFSSQSSEHPQYEIQGTWAQADDSPNHLELARTTTDGVIAVRSSYQPATVLFTTPGQLTALASNFSTVMRQTGLDI